MTDDDNEIGVLAATTESLPVPPFPGAERHDASCGHEVWIGPQTIELLANPDGYTVNVMCSPCASTRADWHESIQQHGFSMMPAAVQSMVESGLVTHTQMAEMVEKLGIKVRDVREDEP